MITTVTLNPCIDLTLYIDGLVTGGLNMVGRSRSDTCGKGVNVSVVLRALGISTMCAGISFDGNGAQLDASLEEQCIAHDFAIAHGNIRTNIKLMDIVKNQMTEVNSHGDPIAGHVIDEYLEKLVRCTGKSSMLVFSGRIPNGGGEDIYRRSLEAVKDFSVPAIVDAEKEPLKQAVLAKPYLIKPNTFELEETFGCKIHSKGDVIDACRDIIKGGVKMVCCSMGGDGAMLVDKDGAWFSPPMEIDVKGYQGAGDSVVAGLCKAILDKLPPPDMLRYAVAAASGSLIREGTLLCRRSDFDRLLPLVKVEEVPSAGRIKGSGRKAKKSSANQDKD